MIKSIREKIETVALGSATHPGLVLDRYLPNHDSDSAAKRRLMEFGVRALRNLAPLHQQVYKQRLAWFEGLASPNAKTVRQACSFSLRTAGDQRLVIGMGRATPLEVGLTLHRTYGFPVLPGSALKGLAAHYCDSQANDDATLIELRRVVTCETSVSARTGEQYRTLFGDTENTGFIVFHDAWMEPIGNHPFDGLHRDVMTPHHGDYYMEDRYETANAIDASVRALDGTIVPARSFDDPFPVPFLSIAGSFHFVLECMDSSESGKRWLDWSIGLLQAALYDWGIGGKTTSGYGRLVKSDAASESRRVQARQAELNRSITSSGTSNVRSQSTTTNATPSPSTKVVEVELLERAAGKAWKARVLTTGLVGHIVNSGDVPPDKKAGDKLTLWLRSNNPTNASFDYKTPEELAELMQQNPDRNKKKGPNKKK